MVDEFPPLRFRTSGGELNAIPVFTITLSNNLSFANRGQGHVAITVNTSAAASSPTYASTGGSYVTIAAEADLTAERVLGASTGLSITSDASTVVFHYGSLLVTSSRAINTTAPLSGGGNLSADRTLILDTAAIVTSGRSLSTLYPTSGGGDLSANRTLSVDTAFLVTSARLISAGAGLSGGGNLGADRTLSLATPVAVSSGGTGASTLTAFGLLFGSGGSAIQATSAPNVGQLIVGSGLNQGPIVIASGVTGQYLVSSGGAIGNVVWINTAAGGSSTVYAATGNSYVTIGLAGDLTAERVLTADTGLTLTDGGANGNAGLSVNTNVRDKIFAFFVAGNMTTAMLAEETRIYIPFNMQAIRVQTAVTTSNAGAALLVQLNQYATPVATATTMFTAGSRPSIPTAFSAGSATAFDLGTLFTGSYLGIAIDQVGSTVAGSNLTVTVIARGS